MLTPKGNQNNKINWEDEWDVEVSHGHNSKMLSMLFN